MSVYEKLLEEFGAAIIAIFGDVSEEEYDEEKVDKELLMAVAKKVAFYLNK